jgi:hypothetical protein
MAEIFDDTSLNDITELGGMEEVGAGSLGATIWLPTTTVSGVWKDTSLNDVTKLGGMEEVGAGSLGATIWTVTE